MDPILARLRARFEPRVPSRAVAVGMRGAAGWKVALLADGELLIELDAEAALQLAGEIVAVAGLIEGQVCDG